MMTKDEKLQEAKLMAVENVLTNFYAEYHEFGPVTRYEWAKEILSAIRNEEIKQDLLDHEANLLIASENKPE